MLIMSIRPARRNLRPVTRVLPFDDYDEVIQMANDSEYGLAATIWTRDLSTALKAVHELEAGFVQVNQNVVVQPTLPYGGIKSSGIGKKPLRCHVGALHASQDDHHEHALSTACFGLRLSRSTSMRVTFHDGIVL